MGNNINDKVLVLIVLGMAVATAIPRVVPLTAFGGKKFPPLVENFLKYIPVSILTAMLVSTIMFREGNFVSPAKNEYLWVTLVAFPIALFTRNLLFTVFCGIAGIALLRLFVTI